MKDLLLWRELGRREPISDEVVPLLEELACRPPEARGVFAGRLILAARDDRPRVRAAALAGLAGYGGPAALRAVVRGLDDADPVVAAAAVASLGAIGDSDPWRIAHALFHPDPAVRRAALTRRLPTAAAGLLPHLLADEECIQDVLPLLAGVETLPGCTLFGILDVIERGRLSLAAAADLVRRIKPEEVLRRIAAGAVADAAAASGASGTNPFVAVREKLEALGAAVAPPAQPFPPTRDRLPEVIAVLDARPRASGSKEAAVDALVLALHREDPTVRHGVALAAALRLLAAPCADAALVRLLIAGWPSAALWAWLDVNVRRKSVDDFFGIPTDQLAANPFGVSADEWLAAVVASDVVRADPNLTLDARALSGLARLVGLDALERVMEHVSVEDLVAGLAQSRAAPFLTLPGSADRRFWLVERVRGDERRLWPRRLAHLVPSFNKNLLPLLADFTPAETLELLACLQRLDPPSEIKDVRGRRLQSLAADLGSLLSGMPSTSLRSGVRTVRSDNATGQFVLEAGPIWPPAPNPAARRSTPSPGAVVGEFVRQWRDGPRAPVDAILRSVFIAAIETLPPEVSERRLRELDADSLTFLLFDQFADESIPDAIYRTLRVALADSEPATAVSRIATITGIVSGLNKVWAAVVGTRGEQPAIAVAAVAPTSSDIHTLTDAERVEVVDANPSQIVATLRTWVNRPTRGLAECLVARSPPHPTDVDAAAAILMCHDSLPLVDKALAVFLPSDFDDIARLDSELVARWPGHDALPLHLHAWLWRWERHLFHGLAILDGTGHSLAAVITDTGVMTCRPLAERMLQFVQAVLEVCWYRDHAAFHAHATDSLADAAVAALAGPDGVAAAGVLAGWSGRDRRSSILARARLRVVAMIPDLPAGVRLRLEPWVSSRGLVEELPVPVPGPSLRGVFDACLAAGPPASASDLDKAVASVLAETGPSWFMPADWDRLVASGADARVLARRLSVSRQPHAYTISLETLLTEPSPVREDRDAVRAFLEQGDTRLADLRMLAARFLHDDGDPVGLPLLLADERDAAPRTPRLFVGLDADTVADAVRSALATGGVRESVLADLVLEPAVDRAARAAGLHVLLVEGTVNTVRDRILPYLSRSHGVDERIRRVAECFAWGVRRGLELTGRLFTVEMIGGEDLGYTRLRESRVFVNPLPVLRAQPHGEEIVRGLVIHEIGHHVYHADAETMGAAATAEHEGIFRLMNLVEDEHLERNLRAVDPAMGDPLKRLASYAFQHAAREVAVSDLVTLLDERAFAVLQSVKLTVARRAGHVVVLAGRILRQLERYGGSFPRFVRALRMGLGVRAADAKTAEALALFGPGFRHSSGGRLLDIARELQRIFGDEVRLLDMFGGLNTPIDDSLGDVIRAGEGVTNSEIQREVERVLAPPRTAVGTVGGRSRGPLRLQINVSPDEEFARMSTVVPIAFDPLRSADYRRRVALPARHLRPFFERLGVDYQMQRQRLQGRVLDRGRLLALAVRGEPRVMVSRRLVTSADLFLGVAVDCSGSMGDDDNIEKARLFAELLAESVRGCRGIDLRVFGFNDSMLFDAGSAVRCAAHNLEVGGGNNDAAGLFHLAGEAIASRRRAKLLVMISDGLPTECSVAALRKLVQVLSHRHGICCAQVAVRPLKEECFPIHVRLDGADVGQAVVAFGKTVVRLVQRVVGTGG